MAKMRRNSVLLKRFLVFVCAVYIINVIAFLRFENNNECGFILFQQRNCTALQTVTNGDIKDQSSYGAVPEVALPSEEILRKFVCDIKISSEMNLMNMTKLPFIERFKNPCWYKKGQLQCLPYLHIVGTAKCGTTDFFERITRHPDFVKPTAKEPSWLSSGRFYRQEPFTYYTSKFFSPIADRLSKTNGTSKLITGDASVLNLHGAIYWRFLGHNIGKTEPVENNPEYIHHLNSDTRIMIIVRNPIDRLWSEYLALSKTGNISAENFHEVVLNAVGMYKRCLKTRSLRSCMYDEPLARYTCLTEDERRRADKVQNCRFEGYQMVMLHRGVYHVFIRDYLRVFPRGHVLIQRMEDISKNTEEHLFRTFKFLDLGKPPENVFKSMLSTVKHNARRPSNVAKGDMFETTRRILYDFYKSHNEHLAMLLGDAKYNYGIRG